MMADLTLEDGREITIDLTKINLREYRALFDAGQKPEEEDRLLSRVCGLTLEEYQTLPYPEWRKLTQKFFERARNPLADPNSVSASTSA
jgi:hypothetical protein